MLPGAPTSVRSRSALRGAAPCRFQRQAGASGGASCQRLPERLSRTIRGRASTLLFEGVFPHELLDSVGSATPAVTAVLHAADPPYHVPSRIVPELRRDPSRQLLGHPQVAVMVVLRPRTPRLVDGLVEQAVVEQLLPQSLLRTLGLS